ncbi:hypothetical protein [Microbispora sp. GKU 823]|uniref:hypothetical protein n=1 Tax=Microbispora sp. GKU 823 TaxID=1652100 RepID=UPI0011806E63|nr:hypothetical protein [Microbispora sp. GKU 823]
MDDEGWEQRLSERAKAREVLAEAEEIARDAAEGHDDDEDDGWLTIIPGSPDGWRRTTGLRRYVVRDGHLMQLPEE